MAAFVGREQDLETVGRYFQEAMAGKGSVVFITGEAGIGKTTFINEFKARYVDAQNAASNNKKMPDIRFSKAGCSELIGKGEAYAPFVELLNGLVKEDKAFGSSRFAEVVQEVGADWFELVPVIGKALKLVSKTLFKWQSAEDGRELVDRKGSKEKFVQQYIQVMKVMSEKHPLVLFVDDLHWADDSSIYLLFQLAREIQDRRILMLGTYRPTDIQAVRGEKAHPLKDALGEMHRFGICKEVKLGYFTPDHIRRYLDAIFPQNRLDAAFVAYLRDLTEGNPLFVTEQVKLLQEIGKIAQTSQVSETCEVLVWELRGTLRDADMPIPTSVEKTIEKRFERLKDDLQETLQYASVSGEQFDATVLAQMLQQDELAILKKLQTLDRVYEFVREQKSVPFDSAQGTAAPLVERSRNERGTVYQFIHSLVQKSLYGTLSDGIKVKLHAKAAEIIETLYAEQREAFAEELAAHWERGREYAKAAPYLLLSARKANRQSGYQEAKTHAQRGLEMLKSANAKTSDQTTLRLQIELLLELATAEEAIGEAQNSIDHAEGAAKLLQSAEDQSFQGEVFYQVGRLLLENRATNLERVLQSFEKSLKHKTATKELGSIVNVLAKMKDSCHVLGKDDYFIERCQGFISLNQQLKHEYLNITIYRLISMVLDSQGKAQEAYTTLVNLDNILFNIENYDEQIETILRIVDYAVKSDNFFEALKYYEKAKTIVQITNEEIRGDVLYKLGSIAWYVNKYDEALEYLQTAKEIKHNNGDLESEGRILSVLRWRCRMIGRFDEAIQYGMECLEVRRKLGQVSAIMEAFDGLGWIFRHQGNYVKALDMLQQASTLAQKYGRERSLAAYLISCHVTLILIGKFQESINLNIEIINISRKTKDINIEVHGLSNLAISYFCCGRIEQALSMIDEALNINKAIMDKRASIFLFMRQSYILIGIGKYQKAHTVLENVIEESMRRFDEYEDDLPIYLINSSLLYLVFNEINIALKRLYQIEEYLKNHVYIEATAMLKDAYAQVYLAQGDLAKAETSLNEAIALFQQMNSFRLGEADLTLAALRLAQGQPSAALEAASAARKIFTEIEYYRVGEASLWEAKALFALRRFPDAQTRLKASAAEFKRLQQPHHLAEAQLLHGQLLAAAGQKEKALHNMISAKKTFAKFGLKRLEREAERVISQMKQ